MITIILIVLLLIIAFGALPHWPYAAGVGYGYYPSGIVFVIVIILIVLLLTGRL